MSTILRWEIFPDDLDATADFYTRVLGFEVVADRRAAGDPYLALQRDSVRIGAARRGDDAHPEHRLPPTGVELVLEVDDLAGELERVHRAGWPMAEELQSRPWGLHDFRVLDPRSTAVTARRRDPYRTLTSLTHTVATKQSPGRQTPARSSP